MIAAQGVLALPGTTAATALLAGLASGLDAVGSVGWAVVGFVGSTLLLLAPRRRGRRKPHARRGRVHHRAIRWDLDGPRAGIDAR